MGNDNTISSLFNKTGIDKMYLKDIKWLFWGAGITEINFLSYIQYFSAFSKFL